jgi:hypothetical protein
MVCLTLKLRRDLSLSHGDGGGQRWLMDRLILQPDFT